MHNNKKVTKFVALLGIWIIFMLLVIFYNRLSAVWIIFLLTAPVFVLKKIDNYFYKK